MTTQLNQSKQKKRFGVTDALAKQQESKNAIIQQVLANRQAEAETKRKASESKAKTTRILLIIGGSILGLTVLGFGAYYLMNRKK